MTILLSEIEEISHLQTLSLNYLNLIHVNCKMHDNKRKYFKAHAK